jgi:phage baseplate assembly protein W
MSTNISKIFTYQDSSTINEYIDIYSKDILYSDFDLRMIQHPITNKLVVLKEEQSVQRALINLILTEPGERPFHPKYGTPLNGYLFDVDFINPLDLEDQIERSIKLFEPRVKVKTIKTIDGRDANSIGVVIEYSIINLSSTNNSFKITLQKLR